MGDFQVSEKKGLGVLTKVLKDAEIVKVPSKVDGLSISTIGKNAFKGFKELKKVELPEGVTTIEEDAFKDCDNLKIVFLPKSIKKIHPGAFRGCSNLKPLYIPSKTFKFTKEQFDDEGSNLRFKYPERIKPEDENWVDDIWSGYLSLGTDYKDIIITGYDIDYDSDYHEIKKSKEGFYYFINSDNTVTIGHGDEPYKFDGKDIVIPSKIDGKVVKAIGTEAFLGVDFLSMILPESVKIISSHAFYQARFNYLQLPSSLDYLNNSILGGFSFLAKAFNIEGSDFSNYTNYVKMPLSIKEYDKESLNVPSDHCFIFDEYPQYRVDERKMFFGQFYYDKKTYISYTISENNTLTILSAPKGGPKDVPTEINGIKVTGWDTRMIVNFSRNVTSINQDTLKEYTEETDEGIKVNFPDEIDEDFIFKLLSNKKASEEIIIPENVKRITSFFDEKITINEDTKITLPNNLEVLSGISSSDKPFFIPKSVKEVSNISGTFLIEEGSKINGDELREKFYSTIIDHVIGQGNNGEFDYVITSKNSAKSAFLINFTGDNELTIGEAIDGYPIIGCLLNVEKELDTLTINNSHIGDKTYFNDFHIKPHEHVNTFAIGGIKKIHDLKKLLDFSQYNVGGRMEILEGVEEIEDYDRYGFIISFSGDGETEDEYKRTLRLPKSLKRVGHNALKDMNIYYVEAYKDTVIEYDALEDKCMVTKYDDNGNLSDKPSSSFGGGLSGEFVLDDDASVGGGLSSSSFSDNTPSNTNQKVTTPLVEAILDEDLENSYNQMVMKGQEILDDGKLTDIWIENEFASANCIGSNGEKYFININLDSNGKLETYCECPSYRNGLRKGISISRNRCKHIYALMLYIKHEYAGAKRTYSNRTQINLAKPVTSAAPATATPTPAPTVDPKVQATMTAAEKRSKFNWKYIISACVATALLTLISLIMMLNVTGEVTYHLVNGTEVVSKTQHTSIKMSSYFNGFGIFSMIVAILGAIAIPFIAKSKNNKILFGMLGVTLFAMIGMFSYIGAEASVRAFKFTSSVGSYHYEIDSIQIAGPYVLGKTLCIFGFVSSIVASALSVKEALGK